MSTEFVVLDGDTGKVYGPFASQEQYITWARETYWSEAGISTDYPQPDWDDEEKAHEALFWLNLSQWEWCPIQEDNA